MTSILDFSTCDKEAGPVDLFAVLSDRLITRCIVRSTRGQGDRGQAPWGSAPQVREATTWPRRYQGAQPPGRGIVTENKQCPQGIASCYFSPCFTKERDMVKKSGVKYDFFSTPNRKNTHSLLTGS